MTAITSAAELPLFNDSEPSVRYVAIYVRISDDHRGKKEGVHDQEELGRAYAALHFPGVPVLVFSDPSLTAADEDVFRPGWEALQDALALGRICVVISCEQSRLIRGAARWDNWLDKAELAGVDSVHSYRGGELWRNGGERLVTGIKSVIDEHEIRVMKVRGRERRNARAAKGLPHLGQPVFGYEVAAPSFKVVDDEADIVRDCVDRVLAGHTLTSIADDLTERGIATRRGGQWRNGNLRKMLESPTHVALFTHDGVERTGTWDPILDESKWREMCAVLAERGPKLARKTRRHLLSTIIRCGVCTKPAYGIERDITRRGKPVHERIYRCVDGCTSIVELPVDEHVLALVRDGLRNPTVAAEWNGSDDHAARRDELTTKLSKIAERRRDLARRAADVDDAFDDLDYDEARAVLDESKNAAQRELAQLPIDDRPDVDESLELLEHGTIAEQRRVITTYVDHVELLPGRSVGLRGPEHRLVVVPRTRR